jgi:type IV secretion system protein VirB9
VIYHLLAAPGRVSDLILQPGEVITSIAAGDTARWTIGDTSSGSGEAKRVHVLVKPFSAGLSTNLVIATDRRTYHLQLSSTVGTAMAASRGATRRMSCWRSSARRPRPRPSNRSRRVSMFKA